MTNHPAEEAKIRRLIRLAEKGDLEPARRYLLNFVGMISEPAGLRYMLNGILAVFDHASVQAAKREVAKVMEGREP